jgi:proline racemase
MDKFKIVEGKEQWFNIKTMEADETVKIWIVVNSNTNEKIRTFQDKEKAEEFLKKLND